MTGPRRTATILALALIFGLETEHRLGIAVAVLAALLVIVVLAFVFRIYRKLRPDRKKPH